ncbi:T9SS type A sorting domain-containing protein [Winogradskyella sp. HB-48]|uniref:T9SS type A sorting domain-containing protein n=1 Tax=Winogradskyella sp. HB-48 TaxID=3416808 RepID=UPI003CEFA300
MKKIIYLYVLLLMCCWQGNAQVGCGDTFLDSGGDAAGYAANELSTTTIMPDNPGDVVSVTFTYVDIETRGSATAGCWDWLRVYDGPDDTFPLIGEFCGEESGDGGVAGNAANQLSIGDTFTSTDASGAITFVFDSDSSVQETGWSADVTCAPAPTCVAPTIDSATVVDSCNPDGTGTFNVEVVVSDAGDAGTVISDGTNTYPVVVGTVTAGPYNSGDSVTLTVDTVDDACDASLGNFTFTCPQPAPDNDLCADAEMIACGDTVTGDTTTATSDPGQTYCGTSAPSSSNGGVWYSFMGDGGEATFDLSGSSFDTKIYVYTGACGDLTCLDGDDDGGDGTTSLITVTTEAGTAYYVYVSGFSTNRGAYTMNVTCVAPPECVEPTIDSATVVDSCNPDGTGTFNVEVVVSDAGDAGTVISDGTNTYPVVVGTVVAGPYNSGDTVTLTIDATDDACDSSLGDFTFTCPLPAPDNDDCANATAIACGDTVMGSTTNATNTAGNDSNDVFYSLAGTSAGEEITASLCGSGFDTIITVLDACDGTEIISNDDACGLQSEVTFTSDGSTTYIILVEGFFSTFSGGASGDYTLSVTCVAPPECVEPTIDSATVVDSCNPDGTGTFNVEVVVSDAGDTGTVISDGTNTYPVVVGTVTAGPYNSGDTVTLTVDATDDACDSSLGDFTFTCPIPAPDNDDCANAEIIACGDTVMGSTANATDSGNNSSTDVFYVLSGTVAGEEVTASLCGSSFDTFIRVFDACGGTQIASNDDNFTACNSSSSQVTFVSDGTTDYYIMVEGFSSASGDYTLAVTCVPPPECAAPTDLAPTAQTPTVTTFTWAPGGSETSWEFALSQPDATEPEPATVVTEPTANVGHAPGQTLLIWVRAICGDGIYSEWVTVEYTSPLETPDNDDCANAEPIACGDMVTGSTANATDSGNNPSPDVFYVLSGTAAGDEITASLCGSSFDTYIRIFDACDGTQIAFNDDNFSACSSSSSQVTFTSDGATDYYIMVEGYSSNSGDYTLSVTCETPEPAPDNDLCENATPIACGDTVMGSTENATNSGGNSGPDVFYSLSGTSNGEEVTLSLCGSSFDTILTVFDACDGSVVATNDDSCGLQSELTFTSDGTTTYIIRVDGFSGSSSGDYTLAVTCETPDPCAGPLPQLTWTGAEDTNWENMGNWENSEAPGLMVYANVNLPSDLPNYPVLTLGQDLYIAECSTIFVDDFASINVRPNVEIVNDGVITTEGTVTFESDATGSAYIGSGVGMFMGDFTVERYIPAKRAYRQLGTPVTTSTPISENWQQDTHITGPAGNTDGFDVTFTGNPSAYIFDNVAYEYVELANTNATNLIPGTMYHILIRGDRNTDLGDNNATPSETTLRAKGELTAENVGSHMISVNVPEQRFIAVGNPFQSQVDMNTVLTTGSMNINPNFYWVWDPTLGTRGAYTAIMAATGTASTASSDANQYLQAGQAGWVYTAGVGQSSVIFDQTSKNNSGFETSTFTDNDGSTSLSQLRLSLYESSAFANNDTATDGVLILFGANGNNGIDANDALSISNLDENFATSNNGELLSIENRAMPQETEEIQLEINTYRSTNYTIVAEGISIEGVTPYLYDDYTGTYTEIPQTGSVNYSYSVDAGITSSIANNRFKVVFFQSTLSTGSFGLDSVKLYPNPTNIGKFYLNVPLGMDDLEITIYDVLGTRLYNETGFNAGSRITVEAGSEFSMGTYFVELSSKGRTTTKKLIIN